MQTYTIRKHRIWPWATGLIFLSLIWWLSSIATLTGSAEFNIKFNRAEVEKIEAMKMMEYPQRKPKVPQ